MDLQMVQNIYDALCKVIGQSFVDSWIKIIFAVVCATVVLLLLGIAIGVGGLIANLGNLIPSRAESKGSSKNVSLWQTLKKRWHRKEEKSVDHSAI
jgi:hypothetical protein